MEWEKRRLASFRATVCNFSQSRAPWNTHSMKAERAMVQKHRIQRRARFHTALRSSALGAPQ